MDTNETLRILRAALDLLQGVEEIGTPDGARALLEAEQGLRKAMAEAKKVKAE